MQNITHKTDRWQAIEGEIIMYNLSKTTERNVRIIAVIFVLCNILTLLTRSF
jgi:hypothetical protein